MNFIEVKNERKLIINIDAKEIEPKSVCFLAKEDFKENLSYF